MTFCHRDNNRGHPAQGQQLDVFGLNKAFLLSSEVPTDAFIGAKFTLWARRKLPLFGPKVQLTYVSLLGGGGVWGGLFLIKSDSLT